MLLSIKAYGLNFALKAILPVHLTLENLLLHVHERGYWLIVYFVEERRTLQDRPLGPLGTLNSR